MPSTMRRSTQTSSSSARWPNQLASGGQFNRRRVAISIGAGTRKHLTIGFHGFHSHPLISSNRAC